MATPKYRAAGEMTLLGRVWREVSQHRPLAESLRAIAPMLAEVLPLERLTLRLFERSDPTLTTLTTVNGHGESMAVHEARTACQGDDVARLHAWLAAGEAMLFEAGAASPLARLLMPREVVGPVIAAPLQDASGLWTLSFARGAKVTLDQLVLAQTWFEPLGVLMQNDQRLQQLSRMSEALEVGRHISEPMPTRTVEPHVTDTSPQAVQSLNAAMVQQIERALRACHGRIEGPYGAAHALQNNPHTLRARMRKLGQNWARFRESPEDTLR